MTEGNESEERTGERVFELMRDMAFVGPELSLTNMNLYLTKLVQQIAVTSALLKISSTLSLLEKSAG